MNVEFRLKQLQKEIEFCDLKLLNPESDAAERVYCQGRQRALCEMENLRRRKIQLDGSEKLLALMR